MKHKNNLPDERMPSFNECYRWHFTEFMDHYKRKRDNVFTITEKEAAKLYREAVELALVEKRPAPRKLS